MQKMMTVETTSLDGLTFDGQEFWISDSQERSLKRISLAEQKVLREIKFQPGGIPRALVFTNDALLVLNYDPKTEQASDLIQINVMNGKILRTLPCPAIIDNGLVFDGREFIGGVRSVPGLVHFSPATAEVTQELQLEAPIRALALDHGRMAAVLDPQGSGGGTVILLEPGSGRVLVREEVDFPVGGLAWAEDMLVLSNMRDREIYVTRLKAEG